MSRTHWGATLTMPVAEERDHVQGSTDAAVTLRGLDTAELQALVQATASEDLRHRAMTHLPELHDVTMGNPLFAREVLRELAEAGSEAATGRGACDRPSNH